MTLLTQKLSKLVFANPIRVVTLALFLVIFGASAALGSFAVTTDEQVSFTATGTAVITGVTHLPGGLTQVNFNTSGKATHLGDFTGPLTRIQNNQGTFGSTAVIVGANGKDSVFLSVSGSFERTKDKCMATSTGTYTVTGGAGAFANATGTYTGTISRPNSN
jgi:hypothetical protein